MTDKSPSDQTPSDVTQTVVTSQSVPAASITSRTSARVTTSSVADEGRFLPGTLVAARYRVIGLLGKGGMGEVYRATDLMLGQSVALKFLPETAALDHRQLERFHGEVRVARQVSHPNVCTVYDIGEADGLWFISMEYVDGDDLASLLGRIGRLPPDKGVETARKICAGLAAAHAKGIIHRDLKPQNIMLNKRGEVLIMDFGLAAVAEQLTGMEARNGTPAYMSPEQLRGSEVTAKSDIYALGLVLYELFTGKKPYEAKSIQQLIAVQESVDFAPMSAAAADLDPSIEKVIRRCLDPDPLRRPSNALSVSAALPGGDPLAAALAAGETPSPELVASAGKTAGMAPRYSVPCVAFVLAMMIGLPFYMQNSQAMLIAQLNLSPDVLAQKARETAAALGYTQQPADSFFQLQYAGRLLDYLYQLPAPRDYPGWLSGEAPFRIDYRESLEPLAAPPFGDVTAELPAPIEPGMVRCVLDGYGRLRRFRAVPYEKPAQPKAPVPEEAFRLAGLDYSKFSEFTPTKSPQTPADVLTYWKGPHPVIPKAELTVRAAYWKGQLTEFEINWPWDQAEQKPPAAVSAVRDVLAPAMIVIAFVSAALLARRNWKRGRCDKSGALKLFWFRAMIGFLVWLGTAHFSPPGNVMEYFAGAITLLLTSGGFLWLLYLALEPALRARWPHSIVTWNRIMAGRWTDPRVGADVLIGCVAGAAIALTFVFRSELVDPGRLSYGGSLFRLLGTRQWIGGQAGLVAAGLQTGIIVFFLIFGLKVLLKREWLAALVAAVFLSVTQAASNDASELRTLIPLLFTIFGGLSFVLLRYGLVTTIVAVWCTNNILSLMLGTRLNTWFAGPGIMNWLTVVALVLFGFWNSLGGRLLADEDGSVTSSRTVPHPR